MQPIGPYIRIAAPEPINKSYFILEKERVQQSVVEQLTPDEILPEMNSVCFYTGAPVISCGEVFVHVDYILLYK